MPLLGLIKENTGTNADEDGKFNLQSNNKKPKDNLIISCVGYETLKIPVDNLPPDVQIKLASKEITLKEFVLTANRKPVYETLDAYSSCGMNYFTTNGAINQIAQHFHMENDHAFLSGIEICKHGIRNIYPSKAIFRIRIYGMDSLTGSPAADLSDSSIEEKEPAGISTQTLKNRRFILRAKISSLPLNG